MLEPKKGGRTDIKPSTGAGTKSRKQAAADAGISKRQKDTMLRVASVPEKTFDDLVESDKPPTVTKLAELGKTSAPKPSYRTLSARSIGSPGLIVDCADLAASALI